MQGVILKPALIYGERNVKLTGPDGKERTLNVPLQRVGGPLARLTGTGVAKKIAGGCSRPRSVFGSSLHGSNRAFL